MSTADGFLRCCHQAAATTQLAQNMPRSRLRSMAFSKEARSLHGESCGAIPSAPAVMTLYHDEYPPAVTRSRRVPRN